MDYSTIVQIVSTLGFPIACCVWLFYRDAKKDEQHTLEVKELRQTVENNTVALIKLADKLGGEEHV